MSEEIFVYHFEGGQGLSGAFSHTGESKEAKASVEYSYITSPEEIPALEDHLVHTAEFEGGLQSPRDVENDVYQVLRQSPEEVVSEVQDKFEYRMREEDIANVLHTPAEGYAPAGDIASLLTDEEDLRKSARRGHLKGQRERIKNQRTRNNRTNQVDFYTNNLSEDDLEEMEELISSL